MTDLDAIKARCEAATPGPWFAEPIGDRDEECVQRGRTIQGVIRWQDYLNSLDCGEDHDTAEFIAAARTDVPALVAEVERLRALVRSQVVNAGPYMVTQWTDDIRHADPCDCDLDEEEAGEACMAASEWTYAVMVDGGAFAPRLIVKLPRRPPGQCDEDHDAPYGLQGCCTVAR